MFFSGTGCWRHGWWGWWSRRRTMMMTMTTRIDRLRSLLLLLLLHLSSIDRLNLLLLVVMVVVSTLTMTFCSEILNISLDDSIEFKNSFTNNSTVYRGRISRWRWNRYWMINRLKQPEKDPIPSPTILIFFFHSQDSHQVYSICDISQVK